MNWDRIISIFVVLFITSLLSGAIYIGHERNKEYEKERERLENRTHMELCIEKLEEEAGYSYFDVVMCRKDLELVDEFRDSVKCR